MNKASYLVLLKIVSKILNPSQYDIFEAWLKYKEESDIIFAEKDYDYMTREVVDYVKAVLGEQL
jgi:hypothetical protein